MSPKVVGAVLALVAAGLTLWLWPRAPKDPEAEVRALVASIVKGVEERKLGPLADALSDRFKGPGGANAQEVKQLVAGQVLRNRETVAVFNPSLSVSVTGAEDADLDGTFVFARTKAASAEALEPGAVASAYRITAKLDRTEGEWKFISATYEQITWP